MDDLPDRSSRDNVQDAAPPPPPPVVPPPVTPPPSAPAVRLVRDSSNTVVGGVASGIAAYLGVDPVFVRVAFVLLGLAGGLGVVVYLALYLAMPEGVPSGPAVAHQRDAGWWVALVLFGLAGLMIVDGVRDGGGLLAVVLVGAGVALWRRDAGGAGALSGGDGWPDAGQGSMVPAMGTAMSATSGTPGYAGSVAERPRRIPVSEQAPDWTPPPAPERRRSMLGPVTLAIAFFAVAATVSLNMAGVTDLGVGTVGSIAMVIVGGGLVIGSWIGRARWLVIPAVMLLPVVVLGAAAQVEGVDELFGAGFVSSAVVVTELSDLEPRYEALAGDFNLDLDTLDLAGQDVAVQVQVGFGTIRVSVPPDATVVVTASARGGQFDAFGQQIIAGSSLDETYTSRGTADGGTLRLDLDMTFGDINVVRDRAPGTTPAKDATTTEE